MSSKSVFLGFLLFVAVRTISVSQDDSVSKDKSRCKRITAKLATVRVTEGCKSPVGFCAEGVITADEWVHGKTAANVLGLVPSVGLPGIEPGTTLSYAGDRTIVNSHGTLTLRFTA